MREGVMIEGSERRQIGEKKKKQMNKLRPLETACSPVSNTQCRTACGA
jgi:hypothetical protein